MNLYDKERPLIYHRPAFLPGHCVIPRIQIWPLEGGQIELAMMLPLSDNRFSGKYFSINTTYEELRYLVNEFVEDPEKFVLERFDKDPTGMQPGISPKSSKAIQTPPITKALDLLSED